MNISIVVFLFFIIVIVAAEALQSKHKYSCRHDSFNIQEVYTIKEFLSTTTFVVDGNVKIIVIDDSDVFSSSSDSVLKLKSGVVYSMGCDTEITVIVYKSPVKIMLQYYNE